MSIGANSICPCGSKKKYKRCCSRFHKDLIAKDALELMKSRYSAYAVGDAKYIVKTTHPNNNDYSSDLLQWIKEINTFTEGTNFEKLEIVDFIDGESEAFVTFIAILNGEKMIEKSRFLKVDKRWLYESGEFLEEYDLKR